MTGLLSMHQVLVERRTADRVDPDTYQPIEGVWEPLSGAPTAGTLGTPSRSDLYVAAQTDTRVEAVIAFPAGPAPEKGDRVTVANTGTPPMVVQRVVTNPYTSHHRCWLASIEG